MVHDQCREILMRVSSSNINSAFPPPYAKTTLAQRRDDGGGG
jgi:hypothetical protein